MLYEDVSLSLVVVLGERRTDGGEEEGLERRELNCISSSQLCYITLFFFLSRVFFFTMYYQLRFSCSTLQVHSFLYRNKVRLTSKIIS
jgi:hypothetical protein